MIRKHTTRLALLLALLAPSLALAYGPRGHAIVGAIADNRLSGKPVAAKLAHLLDGITLAEAATLADSIKSWDRNPDAFHLPNHRGIEEQLRAFWTANPPRNQNASQLPPNHHWFHYTDVPVARQTRYDSGKTGRNQWDIVHMIPYCADVLQGKIPEQNERKITKSVAAILLAHYVGDIHQPLHVGAEYFDENGRPVDPDATVGMTFADNGGNTLTLVLATQHGRYKLHAYWDGETVIAAVDLYRKQLQAETGTPAEGISDTDIARRLAIREPANWKPPAALAVDKWSIAWADEILPVAREAHERLEFVHMKFDQDKKLATGQALEKQPQPGGQSYHDWSGAVVRDELHKAGWRLAAMLEEAMK